MTYQVLARKWRPKVFEEIVGQPHVVTALVNALESKRLHHAYLFTGTRGVGKTTLARILAKALNCETNGISSKPCGKCRACTEIDAGRFVDLLEVDAATNTKVDEMRELLDNAQYMPVGGRFKVYIIDEVHMLSRHAFNSMLKTLEEPPEHVKFILATTDPQRLPVTILSRCLQFNLKPLSPPLIAGHLKHVLTAEGIAFEEAALTLIGKAAAGSLRDSLSILDQAIAHGGGNVNATEVAQMLGSLGGDLVWPLLERIVEADGKGTIEEAQRIASRSISMDTVLEDLAGLLHRVALAQAGAGTGDDDPYAARVGEMAARIDAGRVQVMYQVAVLGRRDLPLAPDEYAGFTMTLLRMLSFNQDAAQPRSAGSTAVQNAAPRAPAR
ncbi:MAG: DNA polymerase III subunit gamma/tau, partial [Burkholderiales bacterium]|nr:DNA polymerase III subunit gamma/tau [Burkholderiales bacterium]